MDYFSSDFKLGIIGGGQLGKMLLQVTSKLNIKTNILDSNPDSPCKNLCNEFSLGKLMDYDTIYKFGKKCNVITYEIEHINIEALLKLESEGVIINPSPSILKIIQNKNTQKKFFLENNIPTAKFWHFSSKEEFKLFLSNDEISFPCVWKKTKFGYDGFGVEILKSTNDITKLPDSEFIIEEYIPFQKELATTIARNDSGQVEVFPIVEMSFNDESNQVEYVICPAQINNENMIQAKETALSVSKSFGHTGILAVEMFLTKDNKVLVNEVAPRPHNSAHYSIEACMSSQFDQHIRSILNLPLGCSKSNINAIMVNLVGEKNFSGLVNYEGLEESMKFDNVSVHIYGKSETRPNRKMGHATILDTDLNRGIEIAKSVKKNIRVKTN
ncbi:MAG: 5-(carboxyamino)imidazole ribonucleotide synthase [Flavobacteriaceae bacterium]